MRILKLLFVLVFCTFLFSKNVHAQNAVNVNNLTGRSNMSIPVFNVKVGDISAPVALSYTASGLKVEDYDYTFGLGWGLVAGGAVYREVRGFPDDVQYQGDPAWPWVYGWLYTQNTAPQTAQTFTIANDNNNATCTDEVTDKNALVNYSYKDAEPDIFTASAPGLYCSFVFDPSAAHPIRLIEHRNYKVEYTRPNFIIQSFTITNEAGIKYYFTQGNMVTHGIYAYQNGNAQEIDPNTLEVFKNDFMMYRTKSQSGGAFYHDMWMLTKIEDTKGNYINFGYGGYAKRNPTVKNKYEVKDVEIYKSDGVSGVNSYTKKKLYSVHKIRSEYRLESIVPVSIGTDIIPLSYLSINYSNDGGQYDEDKLSSITVPKEKFSFVPSIYP